MSDNAIYITSLKNKIAHLEQDLQFSYDRSNEQQAHIEKLEKVADAAKNMFFSESDINQFSDRSVYILREALAELNT